MQKWGIDINQVLMVDGNAVAGILDEIFNAEVSASLTQCAHCGQQGEIGDLLAFTQAPGIVLRCPTCHSIVLRVVETPSDIYLDARGATFLRLSRPIGG